MIWMAIVGLIWMACFGFYAVSEKQILKTRQSQFSSSISFIALWVFISPIVFIFILKMNNLKQTKA